VLRCAGTFVPGASVITAHIKSVNLASPDVTLRLDMDGVIREVSLANSVSGEAAEAWVGRPWVDTVGGPGSDNVIRMMAEARANGVSDFRQVTQRFPSGIELPVEYNAVRLGARGGLVVIGKNLQAVAGVQSSVLATQQAREQDAWKLRAVETRFRLLLESSEDPVLLLRIDDLHIIDANPAAIRAGALDAGRDFPAALAAHDRVAFHAMMRRVGEQGGAPGIMLHIGVAAAPWLVRASLTTAQPDTVFMLQLSPVAAAHDAASPAASLDHLIERLPDGFVLIDQAGVVLRANSAFLDMAQIATAAAAIGQPIGRWLSQPGADGAVLVAGVQRRGTMKGFATTLLGGLGSEMKVEISAAGDSDEAPRLIALLLRDVSRRPAGHAAPHDRTGNPDDRLLEAIAALTRQIGQTPLLDLVRDTGGLIERHCIVGALERARGNRTAAAEMLGMSRQSLYAKLTRYGMGASVEEDATGD
jgi:transcriptional regulator PpsR